VHCIRLDGFEKKTVGGMYREKQQEKEGNMNIEGNKTCFGTTKKYTQA